MYNYDFNFDYKDKKNNIRKQNDYMLAKTLSMFEYEGLPPSIPVRELERLLQINGYAFITKAPNGKLYAFNGGLGGLPCPYGNPTEIVIANPALSFYKTLKLKDGVLIRNDDLAIGLMPLYGKHNTMLVENDINMTLYGYASRMQTLISASDDKTKDSAMAYVDKVIKGDLSIIGENALFDGVKVHSGSLQSNGVSGMIEYHQYIKSNMFNEIGLSASFNMKKERMITAEVDQQDDGTFPYVYNMMKCRLKGIERINEMYGTDIDIDFGSVWNYKNKAMVDDIVTNELEDDLIHEDMVNTNESDETTKINKVNESHIESDLEKEMLAELMAESGLTEDEINSLEYREPTTDEELHVSDKLADIEDVDVDTEISDKEVDELSDDINDELLDEIIDEEIEELDEDIIDADDDITDDELLELEQKLADLDDDLTDEQVEELTNEQVTDDVIDDAIEDETTDVESETTTINITINQEPINENDSVDVSAPVMEDEKEIADDELVATIVNEVLDVLDTDTISDIEVDLETVNTIEEDENETK